MNHNRYRWQDQSFWLRVLYMLVVGLIAYLALMVVWVLILVQFLVTLVTANPSGTLASVCRSIGLYVAQVFAFISFQSDAKPFPFDDWPG